MEEKSAQTSTDRRMNMTDKTLDYYNKNAQSFVSGTVSVKFTQIQDKFLEKLKPHALILDFGCGSGRDTRYFLGKGYQVDAIDGSAQMCFYSSSSPKRIKRSFRKNAYRIKNRRLDLYLF